MIVLDYPRKCLYYGKGNIKFIGTEDPISREYVLNEVHEILNLVDGGFFSVEEENEHITLK